MPSSKLTEKNQKSIRNLIFKMQLKSPIQRNESQESFVQLQNTTNKLHGRINFSFDSVCTGNSTILSRATEEMLVHMLKMLGKRRRML